MSKLGCVLFSLFVLSFAVFPVPLDARANGPICPATKGLVTKLSSQWSGSYIAFVESDTGRSYRVNHPEVLRSHIGHTVWAIAHPNKHGLLIIHGNVRCPEHAPR